MTEPKNDKLDITEFGTSLACLFVAIFFVFAAFYLEPYPEATVGGLTVPVNVVVKWGLPRLVAGRAASLQLC